MTNEERQRIIEEEKLRKKIRGETGWSKANKFLGNVLTLFILLGIILFVGSWMLGVWR